MVGAHGRRGARCHACRTHRAVGAPAAGSGIEHVEAVYRGEAQPPLLLLLPAKFIGGVLSMGSGLVLGREGPTVHMGAAIGAESARRARLPESEVRMMQTAVGGAGLAVAFNAPLGGTLFALREVTKSFRLQTGWRHCSRRPLRSGACDCFSETRRTFSSNRSRRLRWRGFHCSWSSVCSAVCLGAVYNRLHCGSSTTSGGSADSRRLPRRPLSAPSSGWRCSISIRTLWAAATLSDSIDSERAGLRPPRRTRHACWSASWPGRCRIPVAGAGADCSRHCWRWARCGDCCSSASSAPCGPAT